MDDSTPQHSQHIYAIISALLVSHWCYVDALTSASALGEPNHTKVRKAAAYSGWAPCSKWIKLPSTVAALNIEPR
jgi:hypothetical protein